MVDSDPDSQNSRPAPVRARAVIVGLLMTPLVAWASTNQAASNIFSLVASTMGAFIIVLLLNAPLRKLVPKFALNAIDLLVVYGIVLVAGGVAGEFITLNHTAIHGMPLQAPTNPLVRESLMPNMPDWLAIKDPAPVRDMTGGSRDVFYVWNKLPTFLPYYFGWGLIFAFAIGGMLCINSLMRVAWTQTERLTFPLIQLPVAMVQTGTGSMWRSRPMWIAFGIMFAIDMLNGFNYLYPNIPSIPVKELVNIEALFNEPPLSNIGSFSITIYPFMAAIGIFVPSDLLFSLIFFFLVRKATNVILAANGIPQGWFSGTAIAPGPPYWDEQTWGAILAMFCSVAWIARRHLKSVWVAIKDGSREDDGGIRHRWAFVGLLVCFGGMVTLGAMSDLPIWYMLIYTSLIFIFTSVLTRLRAQLGPPLHEFAFFGPNSFVYRIFGTEWITDKQGVFLSQTMIMHNRIHRVHPAPLQLETMKLTRDHKINQGQVFWLIIIVSIVAFLAGNFFLHVFAYRTGWAWRWAEGEVYLRTLKNQTTGFDLRGIIATVFGAAVVMVLDAIRFRFPGFPIHPGGYVLAMNFGIDYYWFGILLAMVVKNFTTRYYGLPGYDKLRNVAFGILLGEYLAELIWMSVSLTTGISTYTISINERGLGLQ